MMKKKLVWRMFLGACTLALLALIITILVCWMRYSRVQSGLRSVATKEVNLKELIEACGVDWDEEKASKQSVDMGSYDLLYPVGLGEHFVLRIQGLDHDSGGTDANEFPKRSTLPVTSAVMVRPTAPIRFIDAGDSIESDYQRKEIGYRYVSD